ncbi:MAG: hypothetical protein JWN44_137 [Myxococcales bacterium]|nr:hypothetical protein [Myxococcales bacterium]
MSKEIKRVVEEIRGALDGYGREQLQEILAYVFKEYVVEGAAPAQGALSMLDARTELEGLSFAELVTWLQLHLDVPELAQLEVANGRVSVRSGGRSIAIEAPRPEPPVAAPVASAGAPASPSQTSSQLSSQSQSSNPLAPTANAVPIPPPQAMSPSSSSASSPRPPSPQPMPPPNPAVPSSQAPPQAPANQPASEQKTEEGNASSRFSWLEVD